MNTAQRIGTIQVIVKNSLLIDFGTTVQALVKYQIKKLQIE